MSATTSYIGEVAEMKAKKERLAAKLNRLFDEKRKQDGTLYTQTEVVERSKGVLTRVYLWRLRTGRASNPGFHVIQFLADFFGVEPSYFFDGDESRARVQEENPERDRLVDQIALRSSELDESGKQAILRMIEEILKPKK